MGFTAAAARRTVFDHVHRSAQYLLVLNGAQHTSFARDVSSPRTAPEHRAVLEAAGLVSLAFWDAHLREIPEALHWLTGGACAGAIRKLATWEWKESGGPAASAATCCPC
jgi:hypothetical protein